eukprot:INCI5959.4.p1 GENE.INCI5959.4~~INCI5959.4.p1  ORF type:complete len:1390 (-),score=299.17 INCI5959.4:1366-5535(-)
MGVHGLWKLLSSAARTVSIESLRGKTLAIDISIWMVQFIKAMKNDQGEIMPNAHLIGTFHRVCRLLFHRIRPVMVFDGGVPEIKRQTVQARVRRRVDEAEQMHRTAKKLLQKQLAKRALAIRNNPQWVPASLREAQGGSALHPRKAGPAPKTNAIIVSSGLDSPNPSNSSDDDNEHATAIADRRLRTATGESSRFPPPGNLQHNFQAAYCDPKLGATAPRALSSSLSSSSSSSPSSSTSTTLAAPGPAAVRQRDALLQKQKRMEELRRKLQQVHDRKVALRNRQGREAKRNARQGASQRRLNSTIRRMEEFLRKNASLMDRADQEGDTDTRALLEEEARNIEKTMEEVILDGTDVDVDVLMQMPMDLQQDVIQQMNRAQRIQSRESLLPIAGNMSDFSRVQLDSFLRSSRINNKIRTVQHKLGASKADEQRAIANSDYDPAVMKSNVNSRTRSGPTKASRKRKATSLKVAQSSSSQTPVLASSAARDAQRDKISGLRPSFLRKSYNFSKTARGVGHSSDVGKPGIRSASEIGVRLHHPSAASELSAAGKLPATPAQTFQMPDRPVFFTVKDSPSISRTIDAQHKVDSSIVSNKRVISISDSDDDAHANLSDLSSGDTDSSDSDEDSDSESSENEVRWELGAAVKASPGESAKDSTESSRTGLQRELASQGNSGQALPKPTDAVNVGLDGAVVNDGKKSRCIRLDEAAGEKDDQAGFIDEGASDEDGGFLINDDDGIEGGGFNDDDDDEGGGFIDDDDDEGGGFIEEPSGMQPSIEIDLIASTEEVQVSNTQAGHKSPEDAPPNDGKLTAESIPRAKAQTFRSDNSIEPNRLDVVPGNSKDSVIDLSIKAPAQDCITEGLSKVEAVPLHTIRSTASSISRPHAHRSQPAGDDYDFDFMRGQADFESETLDDGGSSGKGQGRNVNVSNIMKMTSAIAPWAIDHMQNVLKDVATAGTTSNKRSSSKQANHTSSTVQTKRPRRLEHDRNDLEGRSQASPAQESGAKVSTSSAQELRDHGRTIGDIRQEQQDRREGVGDDVTSEMREDVMDLLRLMGIPFVVAPGEAEAQCAQLEMQGLVDGIITEDSDVFLFGAHTVYKNFFADKREVEVYSSAKLRSELGLGRSQTIALALMLGSDYTLGVKGIGIVNACEVLSAFCAASGYSASEAAVADSQQGAPFKLDEATSRGLKEFRDWLNGLDDPLRDLFPGKHASKLTKADLAGCDYKTKFMVKHRNHRTRWVVPKNFPPPVVVRAYVEPTVESSEEQFSWGSLKVEDLHRFCRVKFGWDSERVDSTLAQVLPSAAPYGASMLGSGRQASLLQWFKTFDDDEKAADIRSSRLKTAVRLLRQHMLRKGKAEGDAVILREAQLAAQKERNKAEEEAVAAAASAETHL